MITKVPHSMKQKVADEMRSIFYASSEKKAREFFKDFKNHYEREIPSAVKCLETSLDSTLCFFNIDKQFKKAKFP